MKNLGSPQNARRNSQNQDGKFHWKPIKKNLRKQAKMVKQEDPGICGKRMKKTTRENMIEQLEEINQNVLPKEWRVKKYRQRIKKYRQNRVFQNNERKYSKQLGVHDAKTH